MTVNGPEHHAIVKLALDRLAAPADAPVRRSGEAIFGHCMLPDEVAIDLLRGRRGAWRRLFPPRVPGFTFQTDQADYRAMLPPNRFYLSRVVRELRAGRMEEAGALLGVYSHYLGDFCQPAHHYELEIGRLLPPPESLRNCNYHRMLEDVPSSVCSIDHKPRLLGLNEEEALFRLDSAYRLLFDLSVGAVVPMTLAIYAGRMRDASLALDRVVAAAAALFSDFCHTAVSIAQRSFAGAEVRALGVCDLREIEPVACDVEYNYSRRPLIDVICVKEYGPAEKLTLRTKAGGVRRTGGICAIPHALPVPGVDMRSLLEYRLPPDVFERFEAVVGLHASARPQARCRFRVETERGTLFAGGWRHCDSPAVPVRVRIGGARTLRLITETDGSTDRLAYPVWGTPVLRRRAWAE